MQAVTPLRAAEEPVFDISKNYYPTVDSGKAIARRVSWCSPIPEHQSGFTDSQVLSPVSPLSHARVLTRTHI